LSFFPEEINRSLLLEERLIDRFKKISDPVDFRKDFAAIKKDVEDLKREELEKRVL
jgi:hypothetical protein